MYHFYFKVTFLMVIIFQTCALSQEQKMMSLCCQVIVILVITTTSQWLPCFFCVGIWGLRRISSCKPIQSFLSGHCPAGTYCPPGKCHKACVGHRTWHEHVLVRMWLVPVYTLCLYTVLSPANNAMSNNWMCIYTLLNWYVLEGAVFLFLFPPIAVCTDTK